MNVCLCVLELSFGEGRCPLGGERVVCIHHREIGWKSDSGVDISFSEK